MTRFEVGDRIMFVGARSNEGLPDKYGTVVRPFKVDGYDVDGRSRRNYGVRWDDAEGVVYPITHMCDFIDNPLDYEEDFA